MTSLNQKIFYALNSFAGRSDFLDSVIIFVASWLPFILVAFVLVYFIFIKRNPKRLFILSILVFVSAFITETMKWAIFRHPRPFAALPDVVSLINISSLDSFPSQHATIFTALATSIFIYDRRLGIWFVVFAVLISVARVVAGVHYPLDVLTGFVIGFIVPFFAYLLFLKFVNFIRRYTS